MASEVVIGDVVADTHRQLGDLAALGARDVGDLEDLASHQLLADVVDAHHHLDRRPALVDSVVILPNVDRVDVVGGGTEADPWFITFTDPFVGIDFRATLSASALSPAGRASASSRSGFAFIGARSGLEVARAPGVEGKGRAATPPPRAAAGRTTSGRTPSLFTPATPFS